MSMSSVGRTNTRLEAVVQLLQLELKEARGQLSKSLAYRTPDARRGKGNPGVSDMSRSSPGLQQPILMNASGREPPEDTSTRREGVMLHLEPRGPFGRMSFVERYFVVGEEDGVMWFENASAYRQAPARPLARVPFWRETANSRGSRFKKAAVCWPQILPDDCHHAEGSHRVYFAVEHVNSKGEWEKIVLAVTSVAERNAWVHFLAKYIDLYLPPRAESEELQHLTRGSPEPLHRSCVIDGEAPGGNYH